MLHLLRTLPVAVMLVIAPLTQAPTLAGPALVNALRQGGYVLEGVSDDHGSADLPRYADLGARAA